MLYPYSQIKAGIYLIDTGAVDRVCVACFRSEPSWRMERLDFGSVDRFLPHEEIHPVEVDYETCIKGIDYVIIYDTIASICIERGKRKESKIIYLKGGEPRRHRLIRMFVNKYLNQVSGIFKIYGIYENKQFEFFPESETQIILLVPTLNTKW